jgi:hypothetical protein
MFDQPTDIGHRVVRTAARAKRRPADIDRVRTVINRFDTDVGITRRGQEFKLMILHGADYRPGGTRCDDLDYRLNA